MRAPARLLLTVAVLATAAVLQTARAKCPFNFDAAVDEDAVGPALLMEPSRR
jgi:hypothetical protein